MGLKMGHKIVNTTTLSYDYARCAGTGHSLCQRCRRREPGHEQWQVHMAPPINDAVGICDKFIGGQTK